MGPQGGKRLSSELLKPQGYLPPLCIWGRRGLCGPRPRLCLESMAGHGPRGLSQVAGGRGKLRAAWVPTAVPLSPVFRGSRPWTQATATWGPFQTGSGWERGGRC